MRNARSLPVPLFCLLAAMLVVGGCAHRLPGAVPPSRIDMQTFVYAESGAGALRADRFRSTASPGPQPAVLLLHPGGWTSGDRRWMHGAARTLARAGFVAIVPQVRLAPEHRFPAPFDDVVRCVRWARAHAEMLGVDPDRIGIFGYSAGAHLGALVGTSAPEDARVQAVAVGGTPADLVALGANPKTRALLGRSLAEDRDAYALASPARQVDGREPPFLIQHGRFDWMVPPSQATALSSALRARGVPVVEARHWLGHFSIFLARDGGVDRAIPFFAHWLRDTRALAETRSRAQAEVPARAASVPATPAADGRGPA